MTALAKGAFFLAFIAFAMMPPTGQWFCTVQKSLCSAPSANCCPTQQYDCCDEDSGQNQDDPCCVEIAGEWDVVPASNVITLPAPTVVDCFLPDPTAASEISGEGVAESWVTTGTDPPPFLAARLDLLCVRLI